MNKTEHVKTWRKRTKIRMVEAMGGECVICGYKKSISALEFHHVNPDEKEFSFGNARANIKSWDKLVKELKKCVMVCSNCHKELHDGTTKLPSVYRGFDEKYEQYKKLKPLPKNKTFNTCPVCNNKKLIGIKYCSPECAHIGTRKTKRPSKDELKLLIENNSWSALGRMFGVSDNAVRKWAKKYNLI